MRFNEWVEHQKKEFKAGFNDGRRKQLTAGMKIMMLEPWQKACLVAIAIVLIGVAVAFYPH